MNCSESERYSSLLKKMEKLHNVENMQRCIDQFQKYMLSSHDLDISKSFPLINPRRIMFNIMIGVKEDTNFYGLPLKTLNNITLNKMRDFFLEKKMEKENGPDWINEDKTSEFLPNLPPNFPNLSNIQSRPNIQILDREKQLYGDRPMMESDRLPMPINSDISEGNDIFSNNKKKVEYQFNQVTNSRNKENEKFDGSLTTLPQISDSKLSLQDFQVQLARIQEERKEIEGLEYEDQNKIENKNKNKDDLFLDTSLKSSQKNKRNEEEVVATQPKLNIIGDGAFKEPIDDVVTKTSFQSFYQTPAPTFIDERAQNRVTPHKTYLSPSQYITFNGYDRDWVKQTSRFKFSIDPSDLKKTYKNITEISFIKIIIPAEVFDERSIQNPMPKTNYTHKFSLAVPYVILMVDEMTDVSDGINNSNKQAFAHYVHDCTFCAKNGRGYHILKRMQDEVKIFHPTLLASLPRLSFTIAKPNGLPFNNSKDNYYIWKIEYPEYNKPYLNIVLDKFFDKNEFYKGDSIIIKNFRMPVFDQDLVKSNEQASIPNTDPSYLEYLENAYTFNRIMEFMNRQEGHDIVEVSKPNAEGFSRSFMIHAPGTTDAANGRFVINKQMVDLIKQQTHNNLCDDTPGSSSSSPIKSGDLINMSLQVVISMNLKTLLGSSDNITTQELI